MFLCKDLDFIVNSNLYGYKQIWQLFQIMFIQLHVYMASLSLGLSINSLICPALSEKKNLWLSNRVAHNSVNGVFWGKIIKILHVGGKHNSAQLSKRISLLDCLVKYCFYSLRCCFISQIPRQFCFVNVVNRIMVLQACEMHFLYCKYSHFNLEIILLLSNRI